MTAIQRPGILLCNRATGLPPWMQWEEHGLPVALDLSFAGGALLFA